jgi:hypothetical protein
MLLPMVGPLVPFGQVLPSHSLYWTFPLSGE